MTDPRGFFHDDGKGRKPTGKKKSKIEWDVLYETKINPISFTKQQLSLL